MTNNILLVRLYKNKLSDAGIAALPKGLKTVALVGKDFTTTGLHSLPSSLLTLELGKTRPFFEEEDIDKLPRMLHKFHIYDSVFKSLKNLPHGLHTLVSNQRKKHKRTVRRKENVQEKQAEKKRKERKTKNAFAKEY